MTTDEMWKDLTDSEYKIYHIVKSYMEGRPRIGIPSEQYLCNKTGKGRTAIYKALAGLREKGVLNE